MRKPYTQRASVRLRRRLYALQAGCCYLCPQPMALRRSTRDHVIPRAKGGRKARNVLLAHGRCNRRKADRDPHPCESLFAAIIYERKAA